MKVVSLSIGKLSMINSAFPSVLIFVFVLLAQMQAIDGILHFKVVSLSRLGTSTKLSCPCIIQVHSLREKNGLPFIQPFFRVLVSRSIRQNTAFTEHNSARYISSSNLLHSDGRFHHFEPLHIEEDGDFIVKIQSASSHFDPSQYVLSLRPLEKRRLCPIRIPHDRPFMRPSLSLLSSASGEGHTDAFEDQEITADVQTATRIVGGEFASANIVSFMVFFHHAETGLICSGALLSPRWVMTAAHCGISRNWTAQLGGTQAFRDGVLMGVKNVYNHPGYDKSRNDIAVVELDWPAPSQPRLVLVSENGPVPQAGESVRISGFGFTSSPVVEEPNLFRLRQVDVPVAPFENCRKTYAQFSAQLSDRLHICAGYHKRGGCDAW